MPRLELMVFGLLATTGPLVVDSAVKGSAFLALAAVAALVLRRDSAATRHMVWLLAIVAILVLPLLSTLLPQWRVLPEWVGSAPRSVVLIESIPNSRWPVAESLPALQVAEPVEVQSSSFPLQPSTPVRFDQPAQSDTRNAPESSPPASEPTPGNWSALLALGWGIGCTLLLLRLLVAHSLLRRGERQAVAIGDYAPTTDHNPATDPLVATLQGVCSQLAIRSSVTLLLHPDKTIPVVWGIVHRRLMLPAAAREWSSEQLRSVLLHELAHVKRRDTLALLLTQVAGALHWFNPLVWLAAWRMNVERERACDDLVLASGVRPSVYAGHLLEVATGNSPVVWTHACGLTMARSSSLDGRLAAVLGRNLNRRSVSMTLAVMALAIMAGIAVPLAMLHAIEPGQPQDAATAVAANETNATQAGAKALSRRGARLQPATELKLKWGEATNGLRMALAWPPALSEPCLGESPEFFLVIQNVSPAAVRLMTGEGAPNPRRLMMRENGRPLQALRDPTPIPGDWLLEPHEVAVLLLFDDADLASGDDPENGSLRASAALEQSVRVFPHYSLTAEMTIEKAPKGAWTGKLATGESRGSVDVIPPRHKDAQALYKSWTTAARSDGSIPGGVIAVLGQRVTTFIKNNPTWKTTPQLQKMLPRFDAARIWPAAEAVALLDDLAAVQETPLRMALDREQQSVIRTGAPLPPDLARAPWGEPLSNGLRHAWLLEPQDAEHRLGTPLKARVLIHNAGKLPVVFRTRTWHQLGHKGVDAKGQELTLETTRWTTRGILLTYRLAAGEYVEVNGPGIGIGPVGNRADWQQTRVGTWIETQAGDEVTVTTEPLPLCDWNEELALDGEPRWWLDFITARLERHLPFPPDAEARKLLLYRIAIELFGTPVSEAINAEFMADATPQALEALAERLFHRSGQTVWAGSLTSGPTRFRVLPADPAAANRPRAATKPIEKTPAPPSPAPASEAPKRDGVKADKLQIPGPAEAGELVFITRETQRQFSRLDAGDGVTLEIHGELFHASDIHTTVRIRWPTDEGVVLGCDVSIASDAFANRERWAIGWVRGTQSFWHVNAGFDGQSQFFQRTSWRGAERPPKVISDYLNLYPGEPIQGLEVPPELAAKFQQFLGIKEPRVVDKSRGLPEVSGQFRSVAVPVQPNGSLPPVRGTPSQREFRWGINFVDTETGQQPPHIRVTLLTQTTDGSRSSRVTRFVDHSPTPEFPMLSPSLASDEFAKVFLEDDDYVDDGQSVLLGNIPAEAKGDVKHTARDQPVEVKVRKAMRGAP
ncbi:MAG: M56 family metallopeptidase [Planctomycetales bacterium]